MAKLAEVQNMEGGTFFIGNADALRIPATFQPQHVLLPGKFQAMLQASVACKNTQFTKINKNQQKSTQKLRKRANCFQSTTEENC